MFWWKKEEILPDPEVEYLKRRVELLESKNKLLDSTLQDCCFVILALLERYEELENDFSYHYTFLHHLAEDGKGRIRPWKPKLDPSTEFAVLNKRQKLLEARNKFRSNTPPTQPPLED